MENETNEKTERAFTNHIYRLTAEIKNRGNSTEYQREQNRVDAKNIASLREGRIPQYSDHLDLLGSSSELGNSGLDMSEFGDLSELVHGVNPWPEDPNYKQARKKDADWVNN